MAQKPEAAARAEIDRLLMAAGWAVQRFKAANMNAAHGVAIGAFVAEMNLPIRGIDGQIAYGDTFHHDRYPHLNTDFIPAPERASYGAAE